MIDLKVLKNLPSFLKRKKWPIKNSIQFHGYAFIGLFEMNCCIVEALSYVWSVHNSQNIRACVGNMIHFNIHENANGLCLCSCGDFIFIHSRSYVLTLFRLCNTRTHAYRWRILKLFQMRLCKYLNMLKIK